MSFVHKRHLSSCSATKSSSGSIAGTSATKASNAFGSAWRALIAIWNRSPATFAAISERTRERQSVRTESKRGRYMNTAKGNRDDGESVAFEGKAREKVR